MRSRPSSSLVAAAVLLMAGNAAAQISSTAASQLPDWSGWWGHAVPMPEEMLRAPPPLKPEISARMLAAQGGNPPIDALAYCRPPQFTGSSGGFTEAVEFLFTPGRVTITNEMGLIRRIYTDGRSSPADPDPTNTGFSVGRWEGQTLVVSATFPVPSVKLK